MSHVVSIELEIKDLQALKLAVEQLGLEWLEGKKTYKWYGTHVGDYPLPTGFTKQDLGKCEHAIGVPGKNEAYEIGVVKRRDGKEGYTLLFDFWRGGYGLIDKVGNDKAGKLTQEYAAQVAIKAARKQGFAVQRKMTNDGKVLLVARN